MKYFVNCFRQSSALHHSAMIKYSTVEQRYFSMQETKPWSVRNGLKKDGMVHHESCGKTKTTGTPTKGLNCILFN